jgi:hypothetical protein
MILYYNLFLTRNKRKNILERIYPLKALQRKSIFPKFMIHPEI